MEGIETIMTLIPAVKEKKKRKNNYSFNSSRRYLTGGNVGRYGFGGRWGQVAAFVAVKESVIHTLF